MRAAKDLEVYIVFIQMTEDAGFYYANTYASKMGVRKLIDKMHRAYDIRVFKINFEGCKPLGVRR